VEKHARNYVLAPPHLLDMGCRSSLLLARVIPPRHHRHVQAVVEDLVDNARAHVLHPFLLQRMRMPALKRGGCGSVGPMA